MNRLMDKKPHCIERYKQAGVSLIEILITTLILGIGLLGVAALQVSSVSSNMEGFYTSQATSIAEDLASRIRAAKVITSMPDPDPAKWPDVIMDHQTYIANYISAVPYSCDAVTVCRNATANCGFNEMVAYDKWEVCNIAKDTLPDGKIRVNNSLAGSRLTIVVDWNPASERADIGNLKNVNANCNLLINDAERNCVIMEMLP